MSLPKIHFNSFLLPLSFHTSSLPYSMIILNSDSIKSPMLMSMWDKCGMKVCADGGANRLYDEMLIHQTSLDTDRLINKYIPHYIVGDLDSLRIDTRSFYSNQGAIIVTDEDQDYNDLDKSMKLIKDINIQKKNTNSELSSVIILGAFGGRFDQEMANIHCLYKWRDDFNRIVLINENNISFLLLPGYQNIIKLVDNIEGPTCGLIPIGNKVNSIKTKGLKWNLNNESLEFGTRISSSNRVENNNDIIIETSECLLWTCDFNFNNF